MKITLAVLVCTFAVVFGFPDPPTPCEETSVETAASIYVFFTYAILSKTKEHIGTGFGISPHKILTTASNLFPYFREPFYDHIIVSNADENVISDIHLIEAKKKFSESVQNNIAIITLEPLMPIPFHCGIHGFYRHVPGPQELIFRIILIKNFIVQEIPIYFRNPTDCGIDEGVEELLCASPTNEELVFDRTEFLGSPVFTQYGQLIGIMTSRFQISRNRHNVPFIVTIISERIYRFIEDAINRTDLEMNRYRAEQFYIADHYEYPQFTYFS